MLIELRKSLDGFAWCYIISSMSDCIHTPQNSEWQYDVRGIPLCRTCPKCEKERLSSYRADVLTEEQQMIVFGKVVTEKVYDEDVLPLDSDY